MSMKFERDERKFDFHDIGCEIKRKRETSGMTQDQLALIIDRDPRTIIYNENDGQHPSLNTLILSRLVDTFISKISLTMLPVPKPHNTACVLSWEEARRWQSRSSGYSSS